MATNTKTLEAILNEVTLLRKEVAELMSSKAPKGSAKAKAPKEVDPDAPKKAPNAWILFTGRVRAALKEAGLPAGKEAQQYASYLKNTYPGAYDMGSEEILEHHAEWTPPPPKPKEAEEEEEEAKPKEKPKRVLSEEHKAKMAAGRKAAAERRKAEAAAKEAEAALKALEGLVEEAEEEVAAVPTPKPKAPPKAPKALKAIPFKGKKLLMDEETGGCWENKEGVKGKWVGVMEGTGKDRVLKADAEEPEE